MNIDNLPYKYEECCVCGIDHYFDTSNNLLISKCNHLMCEKCVNEHYGLKRTEKCPICRAFVDKSEYHRALEKYEKEVENDNRIREKILKIYDKTERDFPNLREYYDYLEEIEELICMRREGGNGEEVDKRIREYQLRTNAEKDRNKLDASRNLQKYGRAEPFDWSSLKYPMAGEKVELKGENAPTQQSYYRAAGYPLEDCNKKGINELYATKQIFSK